MQQLKSFGPDIWTADGPIVRTMGIGFPTRMAVVRLGDGSLWINSPVQGSREEIESVSVLGEVRHLVAPTAMHVWRLHDWAEVFPHAQRWGPPRPRSKDYDNVLTDAPVSGWSADLKQLVFRGNALLDEVHFLHERSGTVVIGDFIQTWPAQPGRPILNVLLKVAGVTEGGVPLDIKLSFWNRRLARESLEKLLTWDFDRLILAHGPCVESAAKAFVRRAFRWLG